jgi:hypothetical protein
MPVSTGHPDWGIAGAICNAKRPGDRSTFREIAEKHKVFSGV